MSSTETIRTKLTTQYPQILALCNNSTSFIDEFIEDAKLEINESIWGDKYDRGVMLLAMHYITEALPRAINSGVIVREKTDNNETEYLRPSLNNFGMYSTTKYGRQFEALKNSVGRADDFAFIV